MYEFLPPLTSCTSLVSWFLGGARDTIHGDMQSRVKPHNYDSLVQPFELTVGGLAKLLPDEIEITSKE